MLSAVYLILAYVAVALTVGLVGWLLNGSWRVAVLPPRRFRPPPLPPSLRSRPWAGDDTDRRVELLEWNRVVPHGRMRYLPPEVVEAMLQGDER